MNGLKNLLNSLTMYKVVLYALIVIVVWSFVLVLMGQYQFHLGWMVGSLMVMSMVAWLSNSLIAKLFRLEPNSESYLISALILFLIFSPAGNSVELGWLVAVVVIAMVSKYLVAIHAKHIFNPAAFGAFMVSLTGVIGASWWVASPWMTPIVAVTGALVVWKLKKLAMVAVFFGVAVVTLLVANWSIIDNPIGFLYEIFSSWPLLFFGLFMFSEPSTTPGRFTQQLAYGGMVGILFGLKFEFGVVYSTPELILLIGNIYSFIVSNRQGLKLRLKSHKEAASSIHEFRFERGNFAFLPGQYLEWTLPHQKVDFRGNRRYFTIASSPSEEEVIIANKMPEKASSFKVALVNMKVGDQIQATNLAGDFVMSKPDEKMVWIAGGIGVTPFRSMAKWLMDQKVSADVVLFYACNSYEELAFRETFSTAEKVGLKMVEVIKDDNNTPKGWKGEIGFVTEVMVQKYVPDWRSRKFYISGPSMMVDNYKKMLKGIGVRESQIVTDFFPGY